MYHGEVHSDKFESTAVYLLFVLIPFAIYLILEKRVRKLFDPHDVPAGSFAALEDKTAEAA